MNYEIIKHPRYKYKLTETTKHHLLSYFPHRFNIITPYIILSNGVLIMNKGYAWDGPSGPTIDTVDFLKGSLVHDALYQLIREKHLPRKYRKIADKELKKICIKQGMPSWRVWYVYAAVRIFGWYAVR